MKSVRWVKDNPLITLDIVKLVLLLLLAIMFVNFNVKIADLTKSTHKIAQQDTHIIKQLQDSSNQRTKQIQTLTNHIDCVVSLFSKPDRSAVHITDIKNCKLTQNNTTGINSGSSGGTTAPTPKSQSQPTHSSSPSSHSSSHPSHPSSPSGRPSVVKQILDFLGKRV